MSDDSTRVRAAETTDAEAIAAVYNHYVDRGEATFDSRRWTTEQVGEYLSQPEPDGWCVAVRKGRIVGWASVRRYNDRSGYRFTSESSIYLDAAARGSGASRPLQQWVEAHCRRCGIHHLVAKVIADNEASMAFHRRHGYALVGIQKEVGHMNGQWVDVAILQRLFD